MFDHTGFVQNKDLYHDAAYTTVIPARSVTHENNVLHKKSIESKFSFLNEQTTVSKAVNHCSKHTTRHQRVGHLIEHAINSHLVGDDAMHEIFVTLQREGLNY